MVDLTPVSPEQTLSHLARKAGLPPDGWRAGAQYLVFTNHKRGGALRAVIADRRELARTAEVGPAESSGSRP